MGRKAKFTIHAQLDNCVGKQRGTVTIDRTTGVMEVRSYRRRRSYILPLSAVADMMVYAILQQEAREERAKKRKKDAEKKAIQKSARKVRRKRR